MTLLLELPQLAEDDGMPEVDVGRGRVDPELDPQRPALGELLLQPAGGQDVDRVSREIHGFQFSRFTRCAKTQTCTLARSALMGQC